MPIVCVASSFPENQNLNVSIVEHLVEGFCEVLGEECVHRLAFGSVADSVRKLRPNLVILVGSALSPKSDFGSVARAVRSVGACFAYWTVEDPYEFDFNYKFADVADVVFTNDLWSLNFYQRDHVYHLPTAASPKQARSLENFEQRPLDIFFCGVAFAIRRRLISDAMTVLENHKSLIIGDLWPDYGGTIVSNRRLTSHRLVDHYAASKCVLNIGRDYYLANDQRGLQAVTPGPRTFEAAMTGCVQLYYQPSSAFRHYYASDEIISFHTVSELEERLDWLLTKPEEAIKIASKAQKRTLHDHTYAQRAREILRHTGFDLWEGCGDVT